LAGRDFDFDLLRLVIRLDEDLLEGAEKFDGCDFSFGEALRGLASQGDLVGAKPIRGTTLSFGVLNLIDAAKEGCHFGRSGILPDGTGRGVLDDLCVVHDRDLIADCEGVVGMVGDEEDSGLFLAKHFNGDAAQVFPEHGVEIAERLIHQEQGGAGGEGADQGDSLGFSAGELVGVSFFEAGEADGFEEIEAAFFFIGTSPFFESVGDVLSDGEVGEKIAALGDESDLALVWSYEFSGAAEESFAQGNLSFLRSFEPADGAEEARFSAAAFSDDAENLGGSESE
tara:strand:+ start:2657 stop:3508 length:852 start_codon:yes stop_codon:yes gene_type:complete